MNIRSIVLLGILLSMITPQLVFATQYRVEIDTSAIQGTAGAIAFDFTSNTPGDNTTSILNFTHDGTTGLPETQGGLILGDIILLLNPAPFTEIKDSFFFNELLVPFTSFGTHISFTVQITENPPGAGVIPDEFAFFILDANRQPLFMSADPLGADALYVICVDGTTTGLLSPFDPTTFTPPDLLEIFTSGTTPGDTDGDGILDDEDACLNSDLSPTVVIDDCDSGVTNHLLDDGCTIKDLIDACATGALRNHGEFVRCVADMTNDLQRDGIISGREKGAIQSCAAQADIP